MLIYHWINKEKERFYKIIVQKNIDNINLMHYWGSCITKRGGKKNISVNSEELAKKNIDKMIKRRKSRGYELISS